jgi:hypothetical protein
LERPVVDWDDFDQTHHLDSLVALIDQLDLVISVSNTTVHLAGAAGKPVWVLLPHCGVWRWTQGRERSLWYANARQMRRRISDDAEELLGRVADELADVVLRSARSVTAPHVKFANAKAGKQKEGRRDGGREGETLDPGMKSNQSPILGPQPPLPNTAPRLSERQASARG